MQAVVTASKAACPISCASSNISSRKRVSASQLTRVPTIGYRIQATAVKGCFNTPSSAQGLNRIHASKLAYCETSNRVGGLSGSLEGSSVDLTVSQARGVRRVGQQRALRGRKFSVLAVATPDRNQEGSRNEGGEEVPGSSPSIGTPGTGNDGPSLRAIVVGAGPSGALAALILARQGFEIDVFERRAWNDEQNQWAAPHAGWNVGLTARSWDALASVDLVKEVEARGMRIHHMTGVTGQGDTSAIQPRRMTFKHYFVPVPEISHVLITAGMERYPSQIRYHFGMTLDSADFEATTATFKSADPKDGNADPVVVYADLLVGADGLGSAVRTQLEAHLTSEPASNGVQTKTTHDEAQGALPASIAETSGTGKKEIRDASEASTSGRSAFSVTMECKGTGKAISLPVDESALGADTSDAVNPLDASEFRIPRRQFTIWARPPRVLGFLPHSTSRVGVIFQGVDGADAAEWAAQIKEHFPEVAHLFPADGDACRQLAAARELRHCTVKTSRFNYKGTVLLGDAAHACYNHAGQGTNLALEDCLKLEEAMEEHLKNAGQSGDAASRPRVLQRAIEEGLASFSKHRKVQTDAAAWISLQEPKQDWKEAVAEYEFFLKLSKVLPFLRPWRDVYHGTLTPPADVMKLRQRQAAVHRAFSRVAALASGRSL